MSGVTAARAEGDVVTDGGEPASSDGAIDDDETVRNSHVEPSDEETTTDDATGGD